MAFRPPWHTAPAVTDVVDDTGAAVDGVIEDVATDVPSAGINPAADRDATRAALAALERNIAELAAAQNTTHDRMRTARVVEA